MKGQNNTVAVIYGDVCGKL